MATRIDLLRHGLPEGGNRYRGHGIDDPLSEQGWQQMQEAVAGHTPWDVVYTSPMLRCRAFAEHYAERQRLQVKFDADLREVGFGAWEGLSSREILQRDAQAIINFYHDPETHRPDGAEPLTSFQQRVARAIRRILDSEAERRVLVVAHAGVIRAAITHVMQVPAAAMYRVSIGNASIISIRDDGIRPTTLLF